jgi:hypothetical protein
LLRVVDAEPIAERVPRIIRVIGAHVTVSHARRTRPASQLVPAAPASGSAGLGDLAGGYHDQARIRHAAATMEVSAMATVRVGDRIEVESEKVGSRTRAGVVTQVEGQFLWVRWDAGGESMFVPSAGVVRVVERTVEERDER